MDYPAAALLHVDAFGCGIGRQKQTYSGGRVFKLRFHGLEFVEIHPAAEDSERVLIESFQKQALFEKVQRLLVLGENDQAFVVTQLAVSEQVLLDPLHQNLGLGVRLLGQRSELAGVFDSSPVVSEGFQRLVHSALKVFDRLVLAPKICTAVTGRIFLKNRLLIIAFRLFFGSLRRDSGHVEKPWCVDIGFGVVFQVPPPSPCKSEWA